MLVAETPAAYRFITQPEHGTQVGAFAAYWGTETFTAPTPRAPVVMAAAHHDAGWYDYDLAPHLVDGAPAGVLDTTREEWTRFYDHGIATVAERDPYAGLLCAMHGAGVRQGRYGTQSDLPDTSSEFAAFIDEQERRQRSLVDDLAAHPVYGAHVGDDDRQALSALHDGAVPDTDGPSGVYRNYRLLQTWDRLSLYCCTTTAHEEATIGPVPVRPDEPETELTLTPVDGGIEVEPFPFDTAPLATTVDTRTVPRSAFDPDDEASLVRAYYDAPRNSRTFRFVA